jgi:hypothetical protein
MTKKFYYLPALKTRASETRAYAELSDDIKDEILPIFELTGVRGYTYPQKYIDMGMPDKSRSGDINKKRKELLNLVCNRPFILDITDDDTLKQDGITKLASSANNYEAWLDFLTEDEKFKSLVIPTIQFDTRHLPETFEQVKKLNQHFKYVAVKLPTFTFKENIKSENIFNVKNIQANPSIQEIIDRIGQVLSLDKLIVILDFGYIKQLDDYKKLITDCIDKITGGDKIKALIPVSSSFPTFVDSSKRTIAAQEQLVFDFISEKMNSNKVFHGDYASLHPVKYDISGGGWIPRIDFISKTNDAINYCYRRSSSDGKNDATLYSILAQEVLSSPDYTPVQEISTWGDEQIKKRVTDDSFGKSPSFWISVRVNLYITHLYLERKANITAPLSLSL